MELIRLVVWDVCRSGGKKKNKTKLLFLLEVGKTFPLQFLDKRSVELKIGLKKKKKKT